MRQLLLESFLLPAAGLLVVLSVAGCDPFDPDLGDEPFRCGEDGACPDGYSCSVDTDRSPSEVCVADGAEPMDSGDGDGDATLCADADLEPNDSASRAVITAVPDSSLQYERADLAVCPPGDTDLYRFRVAVANQNVRAQVTTDRSFGELSVAITSEQGTTLATGSYNPSNTIVTVELPNAAIDAYLLRVTGATADIENAYDVALTLTGP